MSETGSRKLPPLSPRKESQDESDEPTKRRRKKRIDGDAEGNDPRRRKVPARPQRLTESEDDGLASPSDATPRARRKRRTRERSGNSSVTGSRDDLANAGESEDANGRISKGSTVSKKKPKAKVVKLLSDSIQYSRHKSQL